MLKIKVSPRLIMPLLLVAILASGPLSPAAAHDIYASDEEQIKSLLQIYFVSRYSAAKYSQFADFSTFVDSQDHQTVEFLRREKAKEEVEISINTLYQEKILSYDFHLTYLDLEYTSNRKEAIVRLLESNQIIFASAPLTPTLLGNLPHTIILKKNAAGWLIVNDQYQDDTTRLLDNLTTDQIFENISQNFSGRLSGERYSPEAESQAASAVPLEFSYDRSLAVAYADLHFDKESISGAVPAVIRDDARWLPTYPLSYTVYTQNCANFISQAVFEGVDHNAASADPIYPDPVLYEKGWYYKFSSPSDGSYAWINVGGFYQFINRNQAERRRGPFGADSDLCSIQEGDIVFMKFKDQWAHAVLVDRLDPGVDHCNGQGVYVTAHSASARTRPLSQYSGYRWLPVAIGGYYLTQDDFPLAWDW